MAVIKCKMCGGDLALTEGSSLARCEYCQSVQTVPNVETEKKLVLFTRANRLRAACEFDKAFGVYEAIVAEFSEEAEAYWGLVLCKYGIEYVDDPATGKKVPTCHRSSYNSVMEDSDFEQVMENADAAARKVYREEAKQIEELRKGILEVSKNEEPYDIFICYKETAEDGERTLDSVLAQDVYDALTDKGYRVFFSRITLEDKLGEEYEPYIFAALNSAKIMLAFGTDYEYFNAVWVRNEWGRFLKLMETDKNKHLIPCFKGIDAYDLPKEFAKLQAQDLGKVGAVQDLLRGIDKILPRHTETVRETVVLQQSGSNTAPLLKRAFIFLEDGDWASANEYCEKVLDIDPERAEAYLGKLMAELKVKKQEALKDQAEPFDDRNNYQKAVRFADKKLKETLCSYIVHINTRNENARLEGIYNHATNVMAAATTESSYKQAAGVFETILGYKDADTLAKKCIEEAEIARKDYIYKCALSLMSNATEREQNYINAIVEFEKISGWKDTEIQIETCRDKIAEIRAKNEAERIAREQRAEEERLEAERIAKRHKKIATITISAVFAIIVFSIVWNSVIIPNSKYNDAIALMDAGKYTEAISAFAALDGYKDSVTKINECNTAILDGKYNDAIALMDAGNIVEAYEALVALDGYMDSADKANSIYVQYKFEKLKGAKAGDYVLFGTYEQDNNIANGEEDVEWLVLEIKDGKALVISKYALDCKQYNTSYTDVTWETCTLREWLNNDFLGAAFSADEKAMIPTVTVSADKNPDYSTNPGNTTQDQVFLLSITEANKYFSSDSARQCEPTDYAVANGAWESDSGNCWWWLRSPGDRQSSAASVNSRGDISEYGYGVRSGSAAFRPALWINFE